MDSSEFVKQVLIEAGEKVRHHLPINKRLEKVPKIIEAACRVEGIGVPKLMSGSRRGKLPKVWKEIAFLLIKGNGITLATTGRQLGLTISAVSKMMIHLK